MPTEPSPRSAGTADEAAAQAFAAEARQALALELDDSLSGDTTDASAAQDTSETTDASAHDDLAAAREERIRRLLDFEAGWLSHGGAKARAIRAEFGWSTTRYYQVLDGLLEAPEAVQHDPMLVRRLLRLREPR